MKKILLVALLVFAVAIGSGYYYFSGKNYVLRFTESQLQEKLNAKFPLTKTYLLIFNISLDNARVHLLDGAQRVAVGLDIVLDINVGKETRPLGGKLDISGSVNYLAETGQIFLTDPVIENLSLQGVPEAYIGKLNLILTKALTNYYAEHPIYTLKSTDVKQAVVKLVLKDVRVENHELVLKIGM